MLRLEAGERRRQERVAGRQERPDPQRAALQPGDRAQLVLGRGHVAQNRFGVAQQPGAGVGDADGAGAAVDQRQPELPLERGDVVRHDRLGVTSLQPGRREGARLGDGVESAEAAQIVHL